MTENPEDFRKRYIGSAKDLPTKPAYCWFCRERLSASFDIPVGWPYWFGAAVLHEECLPKYVEWSHRVNPRTRPKPELPVHLL
jgi:hypothetical protein